jgi:hypothetical protein
MNYSVFTKKYTISCEPHELTPYHRIRDGNFEGEVEKNGPVVKLSLVIH